jgi:ribosome-binding ATPase YchF (GTP1/OBG family)
VFSTIIDCASLSFALLFIPLFGQFFNAATAFARQRDDADNAIGGATMAPHPFTTIDPNIGFCLVPAPVGSCPEEGYEGNLTIGSTHGRDNQGRRLLPILLKDVAGLVPGAYQGRGRGNKFLNDLTDATVLIHVADASGMADTEGNAVGIEEDGTLSAATSHPMNDLAWIRRELIFWVYANIMVKWDAIRRKGHSKLSGMFSGYGQTQAQTLDIFSAVGKYMEEHEQRDRALDNLGQWDEGDVHRLVSAFLGVRFPMALALNKCDQPTSKKHVEDIQAALPIHGAYVGIPLSARAEMSYIRRHIQVALDPSHEEKDTDGDPTIPAGVWQCLHSAVTLREPVLVFPVIDMITYEPLPGLAKHATGDPSLPNVGMISCLQAAGGSLPTLWDSKQRIYVTPGTKKGTVALRDAIVMKPGSTVENVFLTLKRLGAVSGDFIRAEGAGAIGEKPKLVPKFEVVTKSTRILKIMTTKRTTWQ